MIEPYLEDLENRIDASVEDDLLEQWRAFIDGRLTGGIFSPRRARSAPPKIEWRTISVNEALNDMEAMALQQFSCCSNALEYGGGAIMNVRANYGTCILPSVFGAELFIMDDALNVLPTSFPLSGGVAAIKRILGEGIPDLQTGYGARCFAMGQYLLECLADYPKLSRYVRIYHPDLQGPMDVCELLWGSDLFLALIDHADLVKASLTLITQTYIEFMRAWERVVPPSEDGCAAHWHLLFRGRIMIRDDSAMNLSPAMFDEFIKPYDQKLLRECGGGAIHFCGRGDHYIDRLPSMEGLSAVNLSQPHYNNMEHVFRNTLDRGLLLLGLARHVADDALRRGRDLRGRVQCF